MGEVRADDEEVFFIEIRFKLLGNLLQHTKALGPDHDWHNGRYFLEDHLQERQLDLQAVFAVVGVGPAGERAVALSDEFFSLGGINLDIAQRRRGIVVKGIYAGTGEADSVAWPDEENPFVGVSSGDATESRGRHLTAEHVSRVWYDECLRGGRVFAGVQP